MRCQFCGWDNPEGKTNCEKCNKPLVAEERSNQVRQPASGHDRPTNRMPQEGRTALKATVREGTAGRNNLASDNNACPECGYPLENGKCGQCGYSAHEQKTKGEEPKVVHHESTIACGKQTVRPKRKGEKDGRFILTPISEDDGRPEGELLEFDGNLVVLNRDNTDPKNSTITSQEQAVIKCEEGKWQIEDHSEYKTTFVQASRPVELQSGDLILLGNQLYRFDDIKY